MDKMVNISTYSACISPPKAELSQCFQYKSHLLEEVTGLEAKKVYK